VSPSKRGRSTSSLARPSSLTINRSSIELGGGVRQRTMTRVAIYFPTSTVNLSSRSTFRSLALETVDHALELISPNS
jgi:hypothetical protein